MPNCSMCGKEFVWDENREDEANEDLCEECAEEASEWEGDCSDWHPNETEAEFDEHESFD